jgi:hypothetical protein
MSQSYPLWHLPQNRHQKRENKPLGPLALQFAIILLIHGYLLDHLNLLPDNTFQWRQTRAEEEGGSGLCAFSHSFGAKVSCERRNNAMNKFMVLWQEMEKCLSHRSLVCRSFSSCVRLQSQPPGPARGRRQKILLGPEASLSYYYHFNQKNICINVTSFKRREMKTDPISTAPLPACLLGLRAWSCLEARHVLEREKGKRNDEEHSTWKLRKFKLTDCLEKWKHPRELWNIMSCHFRLWVVLVVLSFYGSVRGESCSECGAVK